MTGESTIPGRLRTIFLVLSVLAFIEGTLGCLLATDNLLRARFHYEVFDHLLGHHYPHTGWLLYPVRTS
jgi:hypothetical protein